MSESVIYHGIRSTHKKAVCAFKKQGNEWEFSVWILKEIIVGNLKLNYYLMKSQNLLNPSQREFSP